MESWERTRQGNGHGGRSLEVYQPKRMGVQESNLYNGGGPSEGTDEIDFNDYRESQSEIAKVNEKK